jgi:hypothetical protein
MLGDSDLQVLDSRLSTFVQSSKQQHETHEKLLLDFQELIENYRRLKSDYEEEKESREKYKKMARGQVRSPLPGACHILNLSRSVILLFLYSLTETTTL